MSRHFPVWSPPYTNALKSVVSLYTQIFMTKQSIKVKPLDMAHCIQLKKMKSLELVQSGCADGSFEKIQARKVYVDGEYAEVVGNVCMDQTTIRLPHDEKSVQP